MSFMYESLPWFVHRFGDHSMETLLFRTRRTLIAPPLTLWGKKQHNSLGNDNRCSHPLLLPRCPGKAALSRQHSHPPTPRVVPGLGGTQNPPGLRRAWHRRPPRSIRKVDGLAAALLAAVVACRGHHRGLGILRECQHHRRLGESCSPFPQQLGAT